MGFTLLDGLTLAKENAIKLTPKLLAHKAFESWREFRAKNNGLPQKITRALTSVPLSHRGMRGRFDNEDVMAALRLTNGILSDQDNEGVALKVRINQLVEMSFDRRDPENMVVLKEISKEFGFKSARRLMSVVRRLSQTL